jgi:hypothetical protein
MSTKNTKPNKPTNEQFNQLVSSFLFMYSEYLGMTKEESMDKVVAFNNQLETQIKTINEQSIQLGQNDQTEQKPF